MSKKKQLKADLNGAQKTIAQLHSLLGRYFYQAPECRDDLISRAQDIAKGYMHANTTETRAPTPDTEPF